MSSTIVKVAITSVLAYFLLLLVTRLMGRKTISQMTFFDFVVGVTVGTITGSIALGPENTVIAAVTVLVTFGFLTIIFDFLHIKSFGFRKLVNSEPVVVIENGKIVYENLKKTRITVNNLMMLLRQKNVFNISDVEMAVFETNGKLSVLPKSQKQPVTPSDLNIPTDYKGLTKDLIIDGNIMYENLKDVNLDQKWLKKELKKKGVEDSEEVVYAGLDTSGNLYVSLKRKGGEKHGKHGIE